MRNVFAVFMTVVAVAAIGIAAQSPAPQQAQPTSPPGCLKATRDLLAARMKEAGRPIALEKYQAIQAEKVEFARACIATLALDSVPAAELAPLADLYIEAQQPELADAAITKAIDSTSTDTAARASALATALRVTMRLPKSDARTQKAERLVTLIEALPAIFARERIEAHGLLNSYCRADDIDAGIIAHSTRIIELNQTLTPEQRASQSAFTLIGAYEYLAEALAGREDTPQALAVLRRAAKELPGVPGVVERVASTIERYELVGKPGAPVEAPRWLNVSGAVSKMEMPGAVTWLQFTAHWCGPCKKSYPAVARLYQRYGAKGFRVVMATELYGYFETQRNLPPEGELAAIKEYFPKHGIVFPIAVSDNIPVTRTSDQGPPPVSVNDARYKVGGIPQIQILDKKGIVRLIIVGWDEANEERYARFIARLLAE